MNLSELQKEAHAIAKEHGWWDKERTFGDLISLVHSELSEALEAYRWDGLAWQTATEQHPPEGVQFELADVVIRVADMAEHYGANLQAIYDIEKNLVVLKPDQKTFGDWIANAHQWLSKAMESETQPADAWYDLGVLIAIIEKMAAHYGIDLDAAIEAKMEYNKTCPYRHGGKAL